MFCEDLQIVSNQQRATEQTREVLEEEKESSSKKMMNLINT
jgi:hypothetical protein